MQTAWVQKSTPPFFAPILPEARLPCADSFLLKFNGMPCGFNFLNAFESEQSSERIMLFQLATKCSEPEFGGMNNVGAFPTMERGLAGLSRIGRKLDSGKHGDAENHRMASMSNRTPIRRDFDHLELRRFQACELFDEGLTKADVARELGVSFASARRWFEAWKKHGNAGLRKAGRAGRRPRMNPEQLQQLEIALTGSPRNYGIPATRWTVLRVKTLIRILTGIEFHSQHVGRLLHSRGLEWRAPNHTNRQRFVPLVIEKR